MSFGEKLVLGFSIVVFVLVIATMSR